MKTLFAVAGGLVWFSLLIFLPVPQDDRKPEIRRPSRVTFRAETKPSYGPEVGRLLESMQVSEIRTFTDPGPIPAFDFDLWSTEANRVLTERFEVPEMKVFTYARLRATPTSCEAINLYDRVNDTANIPLADLGGRPIPPELLRHAFFHAWIHHLEKWRAVPRAQPGHESEFDRFMQILGLVPPKR
jgi:hypothetical protein